jgi:hypothetical protein
MERATGFEPVVPGVEVQAPIQFGTRALHQRQDSNLQLPFGRARNRRLGCRSPTLV